MTGYIKWGIVRMCMLFISAIFIAGMMSGCSTKISEEPNVSTEAVNEKLMGDATLTEATETQEPEPDIKTITITATGDCTFGPTQTHGYAGSVFEYYDNNGPDYFMQNVRDIFLQDDFTLVNLECALTNSDARVEKEFSLKGKPEYTSIMTGSSIEGCTMGNNHTLDYGEGGLQDTKDAVQAAGLSYAWNNEVGTYTTKDGMVIGFVSVSLLSQAVERQEMVRTGIETLRNQGVDLVIAACHWGEERTYYPTDYQQTMAHNCIDWGADVVIGCHPHVLQGLEVYNGRVICYSLGNFCFGGNSNPADKDTMIYQQTFTFVDGQLQQDLNAQIIPCTVSGHDGYNDYQPAVAQGDRRTKILENVKQYSAAYSEVTFDESGKLVMNVVD